eukprot:jgi/Bigna1/129132/aug1.8_g3840
MRGQILALHCTLLLLFVFIEGFSEKVVPKLVDSSIPATSPRTQSTIVVVEGEGELSTFDGHVIETEAVAIDPQIFSRNLPVPFSSSSAPVASGSSTLRKGMRGALEGLDIAQNNNSNDRSEFISNDPQDSLHEELKSSDKITLGTSSAATGGANNVVLIPNIFQDTAEESHVQSAENHEDNYYIQVAEFREPSDYYKAVEYRDEL